MNKHAQQYTLTSDEIYFSMVTLCCALMLVGLIFFSFITQEKTVEPVASNNAMTIHEMLDNGGEIVGTPNVGHIFVLQMPDKILYKCRLATDECELIDIGHTK